MTTTTDLIDRLKTIKKLESDYAAARELGLTRAALSNYRAGTHHADDMTAVRLATALGIDPFKTIARINAERAKKPEDRAFWKRIASAAALACLAIYTAMPSAASARSVSSIAEPEHFTFADRSRHCARYEWQVQARLCVDPCAMVSAAANSALHPQPSRFEAA